MPQSSTRFERQTSSTHPGACSAFYQTKSKIHTALKAPVSGFGPCSDLVTSRVNNERTQISSSATSHVCHLMWCKAEGQL